MICPRDKCHKRFKPKNRQQLYCSPACQRKVAAAKYEGKLAEARRAAKPETVVGSPLGPAAKAFLYKGLFR